MTMSHSQRPRAARRAASLAVACLLLAFLAAVFAPAGHATAAIADPISAVRTADTGAVLDAHSDAHPDGLEPAGSRHLLQILPWWWYPPCRWGCRVHWCIWGWWFGYCRYNNFLYRCYRPKWWPYWPYWPFSTSSRVGSYSLKLAGAADDSKSAAVAGDVPKKARDAAVRAPSTRSRFKQDLKASAPYAACSKDSDCRKLSASDFKAADGAKAVAIRGGLISHCKRPSFVDDPSGVFDDFPGICMCVYISPRAPPGTLESFTGEVAPVVPVGPGGVPGGPGPFNPGGPVIPFPFPLFDRPQRPVTGGKFPPLRPNFKDFVREDYCIQSSGVKALEGGEDPEPPFFVPGQPPVRRPRTKAPKGYAQDMPKEADIETSETRIDTGSIVGQAFVDGLPRGFDNAA